MQPEAATPRPVRHRSHGLQTRTEILAAAERHFAERGFDATRLDDIATEVGIRRAAIFYYFRDKQELHAAVLDELFGDWTAALPAGGSPVDRLEASLIGWIDYVARRPTVARLILREAATAEPGVVSQFVRAGSAVDWLRTVIDEGIASGEMKPLIEPYRFMSLMGGVTVFHLAAMPWLTTGAAPEPSSPSELAKHKREILLIARTMLGIDARRRSAPRAAPRAAPRRR
jgi:TetR/AcrR family transcriptional regulator